MDTPDACPKCAAPLSGHHVTTLPGSRLGGPVWTRWYCPTCRQAGVLTSSADAQQAR